jgi:hypothetical protein
MTKSAAWPRPSSRTPRTKAAPSGTATSPPPTVLQELRKEGFEPFMVTQTRVRHDDRRDYTKHMIRLRHASQINGRRPTKSCC